MAIDRRFYETRATPTIADISTVIGLEPIGGDPDVVLSGFASIEAASQGELTFLSSADRQQLETCQASVCIVPLELADAAPAELTVFASKDPRGVFGTIAAHIANRIELTGQDAPVHPTANVSSGAVLEPGVVVGAGASVGEGTRIGANSVIGPGVQVGRDCLIGSNVTIICALVGNEVRLFPGAVIGENGFGLNHQSGRLVPHFGRVILQDGVSIGANSCVDRGMLGDTVIGQGVNIDNLCHIAHNVQIGPQVVMAAFAGVSGSAKVGEGTHFGGRVGLADHVTVGRGARIAAGAAVLEDVPAGETWAGYPAKPIRRWFRELAWLSKAAQKRVR